MKQKTKKAAKTIKKSGSKSKVAKKKVAAKSTKYLPFAQARVLARKLKLESQKDWQKWASGKMPKKGKRPAGMPFNPHIFYKKSGWKNWENWLNG